MLGVFPGQKINESTKGVVGESPIPVQGIHCQGNCTMTAIWYHPEKKIFLSFFISGFSIFSVVQFENT